MDINSQVKDIKQSFRQMMDGAIAKSMRDKGVGYKLNWGATLPRLREMADELVNVQCPIAHDRYDLAIALWKENVRECKILATMDRYTGNSRTGCFQSVSVSAVCSRKGL